MNFKFKSAPKPEKIIIASTISVILSIIFDGKKKKLKHPEKFKSFPKRVSSNYKKINFILDKTIAKKIYNETKEHFKDDKLDSLKIQNGEFIDI